MRAFVDYFLAYWRRSARAAFWGTVVFLGILITINYTVGIEEEVMLLDAHTWSLVQSSDEVIARLSEELSTHASPETHASAEAASACLRTS